MAQAHHLRLDTPLGANKLQFKSMNAGEELSRLFEFSVQALSDDGAIAADSLLGKGASVSIALPDGSERFFHGLVCAMGLEGLEERRFSYRLVLRPWLWLLTRRHDTRIFQGKTLQDILKAVFEPFSVDYRFDLGGSYPACEYCVQYRESDFDFVSRLLEQEGVYYYFEHTKSKHTLVLTDRPSAHKPCPVQHEFDYREDLEDQVDLDAVTEWRVQHEIQPGQVVLTDYDFQHPTTSLQSKAKADRPNASAKLEVYDHPGKHLTTAEGERYAKVRVEQMQSETLRITGAGPLRALATGHTFTLKKHPSAAQNAKHLVLSTRIEARYSGYRAAGGESSFACRFTAMPAGERFHPARLTPRPHVAGPQTAVVVGPAGEEILVDKHGRVKVQFHWDRLGKKDAESSCWVRVSHPWAGKGWGMVALPRIGQEVVVSFLEGDPDRPLITGRVYNADNMPPYTLPDRATVTSIKSRSTPGGGEADFNELRFEDKKGSEHVLLQAQKDYFQFVKNDASTSIGNDESRTVGRDLHESLGRDWQLTVGRHAQLNVAEKLEAAVGKDMSVDVGGKQSTSVSQDMVFQTGAVLSMKSGADTHVKVGANLGVDAAANVHIKAGANLVIEAGAMITLKAGSSSIVLGPTLSITGSMVMINSGGSPGAGSGASPKSVAAPASFDPPEEPKDPIGG